MDARRGCSTLFLIIAATTGGAAAQEPAAPPSAPAASTAPATKRLLGEIQAIDAGASRLTLKTDAGETVTVALEATASILRAAPGARDLTAATTLTLAALTPGDRVLARGTALPDGMLSARQIVVMTRTDLTQKQDTERADWRARGLSGVITAVDPAKQEVTVEVRTMVNAEKVVIAPASAQAGFRRYAPDSVKFDEARPSSFSELRIGDQVRVLGNRAPDGRLLAEQLVSGVFQTLSGAVVAVAPSGLELTITDNETNKPRTVVVRPDTMVRRIPAQMAQRLAARSRGPGAGAPGSTAPGAGGEASGSGSRRPEGPRAVGDGGAPEGGRADRPSEGGGTAGPGARRGPGGGSLQDMLERLPALPVGELKAGDQVAVSCPQGADPTRVVAIVLLAGIEPLLEARPRGGSGSDVSPGLPPGALDLGMGAQ